MAFLLVLQLPSEIKASNQYQVHEDAFSFAETWEFLNGSPFLPQDYFPVAWDIGKAYQLFRNYGVYYCNNNPLELNDVFESLLTEACDVGINLAFVRGELSYSNPRAHAEEFEYVVNQVRVRGMNVLAGGFYATIKTQDPHNDSVMTIIDEYLQQPFGFSGSVIGGGGMNCPDAQEQSSGNNYLAATAHYAQQFETVGLGNLMRPFTCFLERQGYNSGGWQWSTGLSGFIYRYCSVMSLPSYDWYPCHMITTIKLFDPYSAERWTASDIWPETGNYYNAYANRDELIALNPGTGETISLSVYEIQDIPENNDMSLTMVTDELTVPGLVWNDFEIASSGPVSSDCGNRSTGEHALSGGIVFWKPNGLPSKVQILYHDGAGLSFGVLNNSASIIGATTRFMALGQDDYLSDHDPYNATNVLCQDEMIALHCFDSPRGTFVRLFEKPYPGNNTFRTVSDKLEISFQPVGAVWGYFWPTTNWMYYRSGFVLYDETGEYAVVHRGESSQPGDQWTVTPRAQGQQLLFGNIPSGMSLVEVDTYRSPHQRPFYSPAKDYIVGTIQYQNSSTSFQLKTRQGDPSNEFEFSGIHHTVNITSISEFDSVSDIVIRPEGEGSCRLFCNYTDGSTPGMFRTVLFDDNLCDSNLTQVSIGDNYTWCFSEGCAIRIRSTRKSYTNALTINNSQEPYIFDARVELSSNHTSFTRLHESIDVEHTWGIVEPFVQTGRHNCLMTTVQAFGRRNMGGPSYCPSLDSLMYMTVSPVIHGSRGLLFYNLCAALEGSFGGTANNRFPWVMTGWGASIDPEYPDMDMVSTVHSAVALLTGNTYNVYQGPVDFLSATVSSDWLAMPDMIEDNRLDCNRELTDDVAYLRNWDNQPVYDDPNLNFLALQNGSTGEVIVMVANDCEYYAYLNHIYFPDYVESQWDIECVYAQESWKQAHYPDGRAVIEEFDEDFCISPVNGLDEVVRIGIYIEDLPPFTAALFRVVPEGDDERTGNPSILNRSSLNILDNASESVNVQISIVEEQDFILTIYDLAGRTVSQETGTGEASFSYSTASYPAGAYFVMLETAGEEMHRRMLLLP